jgi:hypothetical protein
MPDDDSSDPSAESKGAPKKDHGGSTHELIAVILLSVTTILTAWSAFESSKWGGAMSISFSQASSARIEASLLSETANQIQAAEVQLWTQWVNARGAGENELARFLKARFPEPLATAHADWVASGPQLFGKKVTSPFDEPSYVLEEREQAAATNAKADAKFSEALRNNQRGDNYTLLTVLFASVLFFTAMSSRVKDPRSGWLLLAFGLILAAVGVAFLVTFPKLV